MSAHMNIDSSFMNSNDFFWMCHITNFNKQSNRVSKSSSNLSMQVTCVIFDLLILRHVFSSHDLYRMIYLIFTSYIYIKDIMSQGLNLSLKLTDFVRQVM